jgi:ribose transport system substrate-binding protein
VLVPAPDHAVPRPAVAFLAADLALGYTQEMTIGFGFGVERIPGVWHDESGTGVGDTARQFTTLRDLRKSHPGGVSVFTQSPELLAGALAQTVAAGTPVVAVDSPPATGSGVSLYVGNNNYLLGTMLARQAADRLPGATAGVVVLGTSVPGAPALDLRAAGIRDELRRLRPRLALLGPFDTKQDPAANRAAWRILVEANPAALAFLGTGDADAYNLASIRLRTNGAWAAGGFSVDRRALRAVRSGQLVLVSPEPFLQGAVAGMLQAAHARYAKPLPHGWLVTPGLPITAGNVDRILQRQEALGNRAVWFQRLADDIVARPDAYLRPLGAAGCPSVDAETGCH